MIIVQLVLFLFQKYRLKNRIVTGGLLEKASRVFIEYF